MHAAKDDQLGVGFLCFKREPETVPGDIGDVLNIRNLVIVRKDDGVSLTRQLANLIHQCIAIAIRCVYARCCMNPDCLSAHFDSTFASTLAPRSGFMPPAPRGNTLQNSLRTRLAIVALLFIP